MKCIYREPVFFVMVISFLCTGCMAQSHVIDDLYYQPMTKQELIFDSLVKSNKYKDICPVDSVIETEYRDGQEWLISAKEKFIVEANLTTGYQYGKVYQISLTIKNCSDKKITFDPENDIQLIMVKTNGKSKKLHVYSYDEYMEKVKRRQDWIIGSKVFLNVLNNNSNEFTSSVANNISSIELMMIGKQMENDRRVIACGYLKKNTIHSFTGIEGYVNIRQKRAGYFLYLQVLVDGIPFYFRLDALRKT